MMYTIEEHGWVELLPAAQRWCWMRLVDHAARTGRPAGVVADQTADSWARRFNVDAADWAAMITEAVNVGALRRLERNRLCVVALTLPGHVAPSTYRVRKHRRRRQAEADSGQTVQGVQDVPGSGVTPADAMKVIDAWYAGTGRKKPKKLRLAVQKALIMLSGHVENPVEFLKNQRPDDCLQAGLSISVFDHLWNVTRDAIDV